jgi:hypothetical protein
MITEILKQLREARSKETDGSVKIGLQKAILIIVETEQIFALKEMEGKCSK